MLVQRCELGGDEEIQGGGRPGSSRDLDSSGLLHELRLSSSGSTLMNLGFLICFTCDIEEGLYTQRHIFNYIGARVKANYMCTYRDWDR